MDVVSTPSTDSKLPKRRGSDRRASLPANYKIPQEVLEEKPSTPISTPIKQNPGNVKVINVRSSDIEPDNDYIEHVLFLMSVLGCMSFPPFIK